MDDHEEWIARGFCAAIFEGRWCRLWADHLGPHVADWEYTLPREEMVRWLGDDVKFAMRQLTQKVKGVFEWQRAVIPTPHQQDIMRQSGQVLLPQGLDRRDRILAERRIGHDLGADAALESLLNQLVSKHAGVPDHRVEECSQLLA